MRVIHITPYFPPHVGGTETLVAEIAKWQARIGHDVLICTSRCPKSAPAHEVTTDGVEVARLKALEVLERPLCLGIARFLGEQEHPDVINLWTPFPLTDVLTMRYAHGHGIPLVTTYVMDAIMEKLFGIGLLGAAATRAYNTFQIRHVVMRSDLVVTLNRTYYRKSPYLSRLPEEIVRTVLQGTDTERFHPFHGTYGELADIRNKGGVVFLALGRLVPYKGIPYLIRAFKKLADKYDNVHLAVAGRGQLKDTLVSLVRRLNLTERVAFLGFVPDDDLPNLMNTADVIVSSAINDLENVPIAVLDGMACGKPVIVTDVGGARDQVKDGVVGLLVKPKSVDALSSAMERLLRNEEERRAFGDAARRYAETISWKKIAEMALSVYAEVVGHRDKSPDSITRREMQRLPKG
ncbi:MAG: glycosyltransferase [Candidatus Thorarchaeota archaeon]|nr:glycosyltransferase [Candidatus Thorarchaeota archaeon]